MRTTMPNLITLLPRISFSPSLPPPYLIPQYLIFSSLPTPPPIPFPSRHSSFLNIPHHPVLAIIFYLVNINRIVVQERHVYCERLGFNWFLQIMFIFVRIVLWGINLEESINGFQIVISNALCFSRLNIPHIITKHNDTPTSAFRKKILYIFTPFFRCHRVCMIFCSFGRRSMQFNPPPLSLW